MMDAELKHGGIYLIAGALNWHVARYNVDVFQTPYADIYPGQCSVIVPLEIAIRAPELQAENERLCNLLWETRKLLHVWQHDMPDVDTLERYNKVFDFSNICDEIDTILADKKGR